MNIFKNLLRVILLLLITANTSFAQIASGTYILTAKHSNKVLDVPNATANDNVQLQQYEFNGSTAQKWVVESLGNGQYTIKTAVNNKAVVLQNSSTADGGKVVLMDYSGATNHKWNIIQVSGNVYKVINLNSDKAMDVNEISNDNGALIHQWAYGSGTNQQWKFELASGGSVTSGSVVMEKWTGVSGSAVSQIPIWNPANSTSNLTSLEIPTNSDDNYGTRIKGYIVPSTTGTYNLYVSGDDSVELWFSTNNDSANLSKVADITSGWTQSRDWTKYSSQKSNSKLLTSGTQYYFEAFHKEGSGGDNFAIGWTGPGISAVQVIGSNNIATYSGGGSDGGGNPTPTNGCMAIGANLGGDFQWTSDGTDLKVFKSNVANWATETNPWNPAFLADISATNYKMFRFMDWGSINWSRESIWSERTQKTENHTNYAQWFGRPIAYEWMVDLCNRTNKNMWINIPHRADDNYVAQLATLLKNSLNSNLNICIEYSNETWNYTFQSKTDNGGMNGQLNYVQAQGAALGLPGALKDYQGQSYYVYRSLQIFKIFNDVFGSSSNRLKKVLAYSGNEDVARQSLNIIDNNTYNPNGIKPDIFAVAPYVGDNGIINTGNASADFRSKVDGSVASGGYTQKFKSVVDVYNTAHPSNKMTFSIYEAGQHYSQGGFNQKNFSDNPNAYNDYLYMLNAFKPYYNTFMQFVHAAKCDENDCWGSKAYYGQTNAPKYNALKDFMDSNNCSIAKISDTTENIQDLKPNNIVIYPNPAENIVTISSIEKITPSSAIITNRLGIVVKSIIFVGKIEISVADLPAGLYFVKVTGSVNHDSKLIIQKF